MAESEWAKRMAQEFKAGKERKAEEDAKLQEGQLRRKGFASKLWTDLGEAFRQCKGASAASLSKNPIPLSRNPHGIRSPPADHLPVCGRLQVVSGAAPNLGATTYRLSPLLSITFLDLSRNYVCFQQHSRLSPRLPQRPFVFNDIPALIVQF